MRRSLITTTAAITLVLPAGAAFASAPPDSASGEATPATTTAPADGTATATIFSDEGEPWATVGVLSVEPGWLEYGDDDAPDEGNVYVRVTLFVENVATGDDSFGINVDHFTLQDEHGFLHEGSGVRTAEQSEADEDVPTEADLAVGESVELDVTFQLPADVGPKVVFYDENDRLVAITDLSGTTAA